MLAFMANGMGPYIGWKQEFSFAMFSNLRPDRWTHFIVPKRLFAVIPRYLEVIELAGADPIADGLQCMFENAFPFRDETAMP